MNLEDGSAQENEVITPVVNLPSRNKRVLNPALIPAAFAWREMTHVRETVKMNTIVSNTTESTTSIARICQNDFSSEGVKAYSL